MPQRIISPTSASLATLVMALIVLVHISGCAGEAGLPKESTPVVTPDSEAAKKAIAEREQMIQQRQQQEAKARRRSGNLPSEG